MTEEGWIEPRTTGIDIALLVGIAALLALIHFFVPQWLQNQLVFEYENLNPFTMWTSAYVHLEYTDLQENMLGYLVGVFPSLLIYTYRDRRKQFWGAMLIFLVVFPLHISTSSYMFFGHVFGVTESIVSKGFAGIVGGLTGFLLISIGAFLWDEYDFWTGVSATLFVILMLLGLLLFWVFESVPVLLLFVFTTGFVFELHVLLPQDARYDLQKLKQLLRRHWKQVSLVGYSTFALGYLILTLFPAKAIQAGEYVKVYSHAAGFALGVSLVIFHPISNFLIEEARDRYQSDRVQ